MQLHDGTFRSALRSPAGISLAVFGGLAMVAILAYAVWFLTPAYDELLDPLYSLFILIAVFLLAAVVGLAVFFQRAAGRWLRLSWLFLSLGLLGLLVSSLLQLYDRFFMAEVFLPGVVEGFSLAYYPLTLIGLIFFSIVLVARRERLVLWMDLALVLAASGLAFWFIVFATPLISIQQEPRKLFGLIFLFSAGVLLLAVLVLIQRDITRYARLVLIALGFSMFSRLLANGLATSGIVGGQFMVLPFNNLLWALGGWFEFLAAGLHLLSTRYQLADGPVRFRPVLYQVRVGLPYLAVLFGLVIHYIAVTGSGYADQRQLVTMFGAIFLSVFVMVRQYALLQDNVRLYTQMRRIAITDSLTGVYNRHFFNETLPREIERAKRYNKNLCVLLLDLDNFKSYNDTYGHLQGDILLKQAARLILAQLRSSDTLARFGGDEFVAILPEINRRNAQVVAERIRAAVAGCESAKAPLSVSIGIASFRPGLTPEQLLDEADQSLYQRKSLKPNGPAEMAAKQLVLK
jgi:diguanylate cyclase (GGDEF)-like protein